MGAGEKLNQATNRVLRRLQGPNGNRDTKQYIQQVDKLVTANLLPPDTQGVTLAHLEDWYADDPGDHNKAELLDRALHTSLGIYRASEQAGSTSDHMFGVAGHDMENLLHTAVQAMRMINLMPNLGQYATWELLVTALNENIGRLVHGDDYTHQATGFLLARDLAWQEGKRGNTADPEWDLIAKRVLGMIYSHGGRNTGDPIADLIRITNRVQQLEPTFLRRSLEFDVAQVGNGIISPIDPARQTNIAHTVNSSTPADQVTTMDWGEFYARNLFPFYTQSNSDNAPEFQYVMHRFQEIANQRRVNSMVMLMFLAGGEGTELYQQVFAPELGLVQPEDCHWSKKAIEPDLFQKAQEQYRQALESPPKYIGIDYWSDKEQIAECLKVMSSVLPQDVLGRIMDKYDQLPGNQQQHLLSAVRYSLSLYFRELDRIRLQLSGQHEHHNPHIFHAAVFAGRYFWGKPRNGNEFGNYK